MRGVTTCEGGIEGGGGGGGEGGGGFGGGEGGGGEGSGGEGGGGEGCGEGGGGEGGGGEGGEGGGGGGGDGALPNRIWLSWLELPTTMSINPSPSTSATEVEVVCLLPPGRVTSEKVLPPALPKRTWFSSL